MPRAFFESTGHAKKELSKEIEAAKLKRRAAALDDDDDDDDDDSVKKNNVKKG